MATATLLLGLVIGTGQAQEAPLDLAKDERLTKPATVHMKIVQLPEFLKELSDQSSVSIKCATVCNPLKVTALFKNRSASDVMERLASLYGGVWTKDGSGYRFNITQKRQELEKDLTTRETDLRRQACKKAIDQWIAWSKEDVQRQVELIDEIDYQLATLRASSSSNLQPRIDGLVKERIALARRLSAYPAGFALSRFSQQNWNDFWGGQTIVACNDSTMSGVPLPNDLSRHLPKKLREAFGNKGGSTLLLLRYDDQKAIVEGQLQTSPAGGGFRTELARTDAESVDLDSAFKDHELRKSLDAWKLDPTNPSIREFGAKKLSSAKRGKIGKSPYVNGLYTMAERLEWLADAAEDVPILADAYRIPAMTDSSGLSAENVGQWIEASLNKSTNDFDAKPGYFRVDSGWLLYRHHAYWRLQPDEISEEAYRQIESSAAKGAVNLDDVAAFAGKITYQQSQKLKSAAAVCCRVFTHSIHDGYYALRVWSKLSATQKQVTSQENGLPLANLSPAQFSMVSTMMWDAMWTFHIDDPEIKRVLITGNGAEALDKSKVLRLVNVAGTMLTPRDPKPDVSSAENIPLIKARGDQLTFRINDASDLSYWFGWVGPG